MFRFDTLVPMETFDPWSQKVVFALAIGHIHIVSMEMLQGLYTPIGINIHFSTPFCSVQINFHFTRVASITGLLLAGGLE